MHGAYTRRGRETGVGFVVLRSSDPGATHAWYVSFSLPPLTLFFFFRHLSPSRWHLTEERGERTRRGRGRRQRGEIYYGARGRGGRSYFKICRRARLAHGARSCMRSGTYGDDPVDGWRYGRQMYYVRLNSTPPSIGSPKREQNSPPPAK